MNTKQRISIKRNSCVNSKIKNASVKNKTSVKKADIKKSISYLEDKILFRKEKKYINKQLIIYNKKLNCLLNEIAQLNLLDLDKKVLNKLNLLRKQKSIIKFNIKLLEKHNIKNNNLKYWFLCFNKTILEKELRSFYDFTKSNKELFYSNIKIFHKDFINNTEILNNPKNLYVIYNDDKKIVEFFNFNRFINIYRKRLKSKISIIKKMLNQYLIVNLNLSV